MLNLRKVAITGGLACGKSSVCRFFEQLGASVVSADEIVHQLLSPTTKLGQDVIKLLGSDVLSDQQFDRTKIAKKVFRDPKLLETYEKLIHPAVGEEVERRYQQAQSNPNISLFIVEIPLLFETEAYKRYKTTIVVAADPQLCRKRFAERRAKALGNTAQEIEEGLQEYDRRMARQLDPDTKAKMATYVIHNNGTLDELKQSVINIYHELLL